MSNTAPFPIFSTKDSETSTMYSVSNVRKPSEVLADADTGVVVPCRDLPDFSIEGQNGLIKHHLLNDRRRVLTLDTAGEAILWDLLKCTPIKSFGKRHLEDVVPEVNTRETVAHWCQVDTRTGSLTCTLEENYCFDAEMYADELEIEEQIEFREDQRINLGKWILRYLFSNLIDEEIKRDERFRKALLQEKSNGLNRTLAPTNIQMPSTHINGWKDATSGPTSGSTIRATNGLQHPTTPGMAIGLATPAVPPQSAGHSSQKLNPMTPTAEEGSQLEKTQTQQSQAGGGDYFSNAPATNGKPAPSTEGSTDSATEDVPQSPSTETPATKKSKALFSKKFNMSFNMKKFSASSTAAETSAKPAVVDEKSEDSDSRSTKTDEKVVEDNFLGAIQKMRYSYEEQASLGATTVNTQIAPSLPNETPVLKPPASTTILIQEDRPDSGGVADLFEGKVGSIGQQADLIEKCAPTWLADVLLRNQIPLKDIVKVSFILEPYQNILPGISSDGNNRLNANRMLRARKILSYVAERIEPAPEKDEERPRPEEYLELYCQNQLISPTMTLASIRAHVWRGGSDVLLYYKPNGKREIKHAPYAGTPPLPGSTGVSEGKLSSDASRSSQQSSRGIVEGKGSL